MSEAKHEFTVTESVEIQYPTSFLRLRNIALGSMLFLAFIWIILICIVMFAQWDVLDHVERSLILIILFIDTITVIMLPILLIQPFRPWLDGARMFLLILLHGGIALYFAVKSSSFKCFSSSTNLNQEALCATIVVFLNVFNWAIPVLLFVYSSGLGFLVYRQSKSQPAPTVDTEKQNNRSHDSIQSHRTLNSTQETTTVYGYAI